MVDRAKPLDFQSKSCSFGSGITRCANEIMMLRFSITDPDAAKKPKGVTHQVLDVIHQLGDIKDPLSSKSVVVDRYRDEIARTAKRYGPSESDFDYETAPPRGRLEGTKDFTNRRTYKKWHSFKKNDKYGILT